MAENTTVTTYDPELISETETLLKGNLVVVNDTIIEMGFLVNDDPNFYIGGSDVKIIANTTGDFEFLLQNLNQFKAYYYRTYIKIQAYDTWYYAVGDIKSFRHSIPEIPYPYYEVTDTLPLLAIGGRFEYYASNLLELHHLPGDKKNKAFTSFDMENLHIALESGLKFPCLFFENPGVEKEGLNDNIFEAYETSFMILDLIKDGGEENKIVLAGDCKQIADKIYNRLCLDAPVWFGSQISKTTEGVISTSNNLYGWMVAFSLTMPYNAEVNNADWEDLS